MPEYIKDSQKNKMEIEHGLKVSHRGFTLIEMILAVSIFSMVVTIIFSSFRLGLGAWEKGENNIEFFQRVRASSDFLYRQVSSIYPYKITPGPLDTHKEFFAFFGKSDSMKFVSYVGANSKSGGVNLIEIWVSSSNDLMVGQDVILVSNLSDLKDMDLRRDDESFVICPDVEKLELRYFDRDKKGDEGQWLESWDPKNKKKRLPLFVELTIAFKDKNDELLKQRLIVPIIFMKM